jgi:hypothetical protein
MVCNRWKDSFLNFWNDMGAKPSSKHSIDRINNNGNYEPSNCRWATRLEQGRNTRGVKLITIDGNVKCITEWVEHLGLNQNDVNKALYVDKKDIKEVLWD